MRRLLVALLLVTAGALASPAVVPVYDGVGQPDEPYRYVGAADAPAPVSATVPVTEGGSAPLRLASPEKGPQVLVDLAAGAFRARGRSVTLTATPLAGEGSAAPQGTVDGNVYRISVSGGAVLKPQAAQGFVFLRAAVMTQPDPVVVHRLRPTDPWERVRTVRAGRDVLSTPFVALGDYAVVDLPGAVPLEDAAGLSATRFALLVGALLLLAAVTLLLLRRHAAEPSGDQGVTNS